MGTAAKAQSRKASSCGSGAVLLLAAALLWPTISTATSDARGAPGFRILDLVVDRSTFQRICELLAMDEDQAEVAAASFEAYFSAAQELDVTVKQRVDDAGFRRAAELWREAYYKGLDRYPWDEMAQLSRQWHSESVAGLKKASALLNEWYDQLQFILSPNQREQFERVPRLVRRLNAQRRHRLGAPSDFDSGIDVFVLVEEASKDDSELSAVFLLLDEGELTDELAKARAQLNEILEGYEIQLDQLLLEDLNSRRKRRGSKVGIPFDRDSAAGRRLIRRWVREYELTASTVEQIADVVECAGGPEHREAWLDRFHRTFCPDLFADRWPDRMVEWLEERFDATDEQVEGVKALYNEYLVQRRHARQAAIAAGVSAKRKHFLPQGDNPSQMPYARRKLHLKRLIGRTIDRLRALLTSEQASDLDRELHRARMYWGDLLGPYVHAGALQKLTGKPPAESVLLPPIDPRTGQRDPNFGKYGEQQNEQETDDGFH